MGLRRKRAREQVSVEQARWVDLSAMVGQAPVIHAERAGDLRDTRQVA